MIFQTENFIKMYFYRKKCCCCCLFYCRCCFNSFSHQWYFVIFHWSLSDSKSFQVSRTPLSIQADLNNAVIWMDRFPVPPAFLFRAFGNRSKCTYYNCYNRHRHVENFQEFVFFTFLFLLFSLCSPSELQHPWDGIFFLINKGSDFQARIRWFVCIKKGKFM